MQRMCARAQSNGVQQKMHLALAQALCPGVLWGPHEPLKEFKKLYSLACWFHKISPLVGIDSELTKAFRTRTLTTASPYANGLIVDLTGTERVHHGEESLVRRLGEHMGQWGVHVRCAIAPTIGAAWALSRFGRSSFEIVAPYDVTADKSNRASADRGIPTHRTLHEMVAPIPLQALRIPDSTVQALHQLGIYSLRGLLRLPHRMLNARYGPLLLMRLDQLFGRSEERFRAIRVPPRCVVQEQFESPLERAEALQESVRELFGQLFKKLQVWGKRAGSFEIAIAHYDEATTRYQGGARATQITTRQVTLASAGADPKRLLSVLHPVIEGLKILGGVHTITLSARDIERARSTQHKLLHSDALFSHHAPLFEEPSLGVFSAQEEPSEAERDLINTVVVRLGSSQVQRVRFENSHIPERSFGYRSVTPQNISHGKYYVDSDLGRKDSQPCESVIHEQRYLPVVEASLRVCSERPSYLFSEPEPITAIALLPDSIPSLLTWREKRYAIVRGVGPERIAEEWWHKKLNGELDERDYFRVQEEQGQWFWVFRERRSRSWFVHGVWV